MTNHVQSDYSHLSFNVVHGCWRLLRAGRDASCEHPTGCIPTIRVLSFFPWTRAFASRLSNHVLTPLGTIGSAALAQISNLMFLIIIVLITIYVLKLMRLFFKEIRSGKITFKGFYAEWADPTYRICRWLVIAFAAVMAFPYIPGSASPAFQGISRFRGREGTLSVILLKWDYP